MVVLSIVPVAVGFVVVVIDGGISQLDDGHHLIERTTIFGVGIRHFHALVDGDAICTHHQVDSSNSVQPIPQIFDQISHLFGRWQEIILGVQIDTTKRIGLNKCSESSEEGLSTALTFIDIGAISLRSPPRRGRCVCQCSSS